MRAYLRPLLGGCAAFLLVFVALFVVRWDDQQMEPLPPVSTPLTAVVGQVPASTAPTTTPARH
ncbi:hypothetical protein [Nocardia brasiliensis]